MSKSIRVSEKHGLNPTIPVCFYCGKQKNEIALMGHMKGDIEAPKNMVLDYEPCDECKKQWEKGVTLIEVTKVPFPDGRPPIQHDAYPTGRCAVVKPEALVGDFKAGSRALVLTEDYKQMFNLD